MPYINRSRLANLQLATTAYVIGGFFHVKVFEYYKKSLNYSGGFYDSNGNYQDMSTDRIVSGDMLVGDSDAIAGIAMLIIMYIALKNENLKNLMLLILIYPIYSFWQLFSYLRGGYEITWPISGIFIFVLYVIYTLYTYYAIVPEFTINHSSEKDNNPVI